MPRERERERDENDGATCVRSSSRSPPVLAGLGAESERRAQKQPVPR